MTDPLSLSLAFGAGLLTVLSPCVLPILPVVFASGSSAHRFGPAALAVGVASAFTAAGLFLATVGFSLGIDGDALQPLFATLVIAVGLVLLVPRLRQLSETALATLQQWGSQRSSRLAGDGFAGQFAVGALLGLVWSPCVGPTLGAASLLASQNERIGAVAAVMLFFGLGAAIPLLAIGLVSRTALLKIRGGLLTGGNLGRKMLGSGLVVVGALVLTGLSRPLEAALLDASPASLTALTTRY